MLNTSLMWTSLCNTPHVTDSRFSTLLEFSGIHSQMEPQQLSSNRRAARWNIFLLHFWLIIYSFDHFFHTSWMWKMSTWSIGSPRDPLSADVHNDGTTDSHKMSPRHLWFCRGAPSVKLMIRLGCTLLRSGFISMLARGRSVNMPVWHIV